MFLKEVVCLVRAFAGTSACSQTGAKLHWILWLELQDSHIICWMSYICMYIIQSTHTHFLLSLINDTSWPRETPEAGILAIWPGLFKSKSGIHVTPSLLREAKSWSVVRSLSLLNVLSLKETKSGAVSFIATQNTMKRQHPRLKQLFIMSEPQWRKK